MKVAARGLGWMIAVAVVSGVSGLGAGYAIAGQPDMQGALASLQSAKSYLDRVTQNKACHAEKARHLVAEAITQVQEGIDYGESHGE